MATKTINWAPFYKVYMAMRSGSTWVDEFGNKQSFYTPVPYLLKGDIAELQDNCALRMSAALIMSGHDLSGYTGTNVSSTGEPKTSKDPKTVYYDGEPYTKYGEVKPTYGYTPADIDPKHLGMANDPNVKDFDPHKQKLIRGAQDLFIFLRENYYTKGKPITYTKKTISKEMPAVYYEVINGSINEINARISAGESPVPGLVVPIAYKDKLEKIFGITVTVKEKTEDELGDTQMFVGGFHRFFTEKGKSAKGIIFYENFHIDIISGNYKFVQGNANVFPTGQAYGSRPSKIMILDY